MKKTLNTLALGIALSNFSPLMAKIPTAPLKIQLEKANSFKDFEQTLKLNAKGTTISQGDDGLPEKHKNWMNYAPEEGYEGMSVNKVYRTFQPTHSKKVIVAVIDSGVDIFHEEFQTRKEIRQNKRRVKEGKKVKPGSRIWKNLAELNGEPGVDDDGNGYVDDFYGWNYAGMTDEKGEPVNYDEDTLEVTREYKKYLTKKEKGVQFSESEIKYYEKVKQGFIKGQQDNDNYKALRDLSLKVSTNKASKKELESYNNWSSKRPKFKGVDGASKLYKILFGMLQNYNLNLKLTRSDNPDDFSQTQYGNNDVKGPDSSHGTHVAGIIAGVRNNGNRMKGVATNVEIMSLRAVPNGDERDKDIALAIRYAADNGADIINMSFGKSYSPNKKEVDAAFEYAVSKGVLLFNAAGNSSKDLDDNFTYPNQFKGDDRNQPIPGIITVGASAPSTEIKAKIEIDNDTKEKYVDEWLSLTADFSNHGSEAVHLFAPGHGIYSATPENNYEKYNGTSMASPAAAGVAALVKGNFPHLTNLQLAEALIDNIRTYEALPVIKPGTNELILFKDLTSSVGVIDAYKVFEALSL